MKYIGCRLLVCLALLSVCFSCGSNRNFGRKKTDVGKGLSESDQRKFDYFFLEADRMKNLGKQDAAFDLLQQAAAIDTSSAVVKYNLANYYLHLKKPQLAYDCLKEAAEKSPDNYWYNVMAANLAQNLGDAEQAISLIRRMIEYNPNKPELNYMLAEVYAQKGDFQQAIDAYNQLEQSMGVVEPIILQKVKLYKALKQDDKAFAEVQRLIDAHPKDITYLILLGDLYLDSNRDEDAWKVYQHAGEIEPDNAYLMVSKANYYNKKGDKEAYQKQILDALLSKNLDVETKQKILTGFLSELLQKKENLDQADAMFSALLEMHPQEEELHKLYADVLWIRQKKSDAVAQMQIAVDLAPVRLEYWQQLIGAILDQKKYDDAIIAGEKALSYLPDEAVLYIYLGLSYMMKEEYEKAVATLRTGLKHTNPENRALISDLYGQIGDTYYQAQQPDSAYAAFDKALEYNPGNIGVLNNYSYYLALQKKDLSKAERMSGDAVKQEPDNPTYLDTYAWVFFQQGNYTLAKIYLKSALDKGGNDSAALLEHYGDVLFMTGDVDGALEYWNNALEKGSDSKILPQKIKDKKYYEE